jgi:hypothetical protein
MGAPPMGAVWGLLIGVVLCGTIGCLIGRTRGRPILGLILGALFTWIGWIIIAVIPRRRVGPLYPYGERVSGYPPGVTPPSYGLAPDGAVPTHGVAPSDGTEGSYGSPSVQS